MHTSIYILFYRKPEIKRIDMGVSIQIDQEESLLNASILISHDSSCNYENIIKFLLYIIHTRKSYYVYIKFWDDVRSLCKFDVHKINTNFENNDYWVKEITFCNKSLHSISANVMEQFLKIVSDTKITEVTFNKFSFANLKEVFMRSIPCKNQLKFLRIEETNNFNEDLFRLFSEIVSIKIFLLILNYVNLGMSINL